MAINATASSPTADSYVDVSTADTYMGNRLYTTEWDAASTADKEKALKMATVELERYNWKGTVTDADGALRWPRAYVEDQDGNYYDSTAIPTFLEQVTTELANSLLISNRYAESDTTGIRKVQAGAVAVSFDRKDTNPRNPITVLQMIAPYVNGGTIGSYTIIDRA